MTTISSGVSATTERIWRDAKKLEIRSCQKPPKLFNRQRSERELCNPKQSTDCGFGCCPIQNWYFCSQDTFEARPRWACPKAFL
jgi:hypothetical protein